MVHEFILTGSDHGMGDREIGLNSLLRAAEHAGVQLVFLLEIETLTLLAETIAKILPFGQKLTYKRQVHMS